MKETSWKRALLLSIAALCLTAHVANAQTGGTKSSPDDDGTEVAAVVNGRVITMKDVDGQAGSEIYALKEKIYSLRKSALDKLVTRIILEQESRRRGVSVEELKKQLTPDKVEIEESMVEKLSSEYAGGFASIGEEEAELRARMILETSARIEGLKAALAKLRAQARVETLLSEPARPKLEISSTGPSKGPADAPVTIIEYSDFECPFCKQAASTLRNVVRQYGDKVRLVYKHMPLSIHPQAFQAAQAAVCAAEQGKFWEYHDVIFARGENLTEDILRKHAAIVGLESGAFDKCLGSQSSRAAVLADVEEAKRIGVSGTPTILVNGKILRGAVAFEVLKGAIDQALGDRSNVVGEKRR
jgi:protein-disulfide isomerase